MKTIVITSGEPAGIGPDICLDIDSASLAEQGTRVLVIADPGLLTDRARELGISVDVVLHDDLDTLDSRYDPARLNVLPVDLRAPCITGKLDVANSPYVLEMLDTAIELCRSHRVDAMVTGPLQKNIICESGIAFTGHTEYLAEQAGSAGPVEPVMMLATSSMRVALATTHLPLKDVSAAITTAGLIRKIGILYDFLRNNAGIAMPRILVSGLNPHAGENGALGDEEINIISPALDSMRESGMDLVGPLPADTLFTPRYLDHADAVFAMYHDQGLPVLKYSGFGKAVNITLGLPFIRTSVDHGTALDLAGSGQASADSLHHAIAMAVELMPSTS